jgi:hypothetical protein
LNRPNRWLRSLLPAVLVAVLVVIPVSGALAAWDSNQGTFDAYWQMSGPVHILEYADGVRVGGGRLTGTVQAQSDKGAMPAFESDCIVFADESGSTGRCVWTGSMGDLVYAELQGRAAGSGQMRGTFRGGTGRYRGLQGEFSFVWNFNVGRGQDTDLDGYTVRMSGNYQMGR